MKIEEFRKWLESSGRERKTIQNRISNCKNVENYEGDLDEHFSEDKCISLLERLFYSTENERKNDTPNHSVPINGNLRTGSSTLKQSVNLYVDFKNSLEAQYSELIYITELRLASYELDEFEKEVITKYRIGQSFYRKQLIDFWKGSCSISGFNKTELLVASHIKPYRACKKHEKYDVYNGLLLTPNYDKLFDLLLISFENDGKILISDRLNESDRLLLGIHKEDHIKLQAKHLKYLTYHRNMFSKNSTI